jgi:hypothetical protein
MRFLAKLMGIIFAIMTLPLLVLGLSQTQDINLGLLLIATSALAAMISLATWIFLDMTPHRY